MLKLLKEYWFLVGLGLIFVLTVFDPTDMIASAGRAMRLIHGPNMIIFLIFLFQGYLLNPDQIKRGLTDGKATFLAVALIFIIAPVYAAAISVFPLSTGVMLGLFLVAVMPTTMSTGVVMTGAAGGNPAHALFVSVVTNSMATLTIAITLPILLGLAGETTVITLDSWGMIKKIALSVFVPFLVGISARAYIKSINITLGRRLGITNQLLILTIVWIGISQAKPVLLEGLVLAIQVAFLVLFFHLLMLLTGFAVTRLFSLERGRMESVIFMGSQKTLPLSIILQVNLFPEYGAALIVCVLHHLISLFMDGFLVGRLNRSNINK